MHTDTHTSKNVYTHKYLVLILALRVIDMQPEKVPELHNLNKERSLVSER